MLENTNVISDGQDLLIGFYKDLKSYLLSEITEEINNSNYTVIGDEWRELLEELESYKECEELLVINNGGMGFVVMTYAESLKK